MYYTWLRGVDYNVGIFISLRHVYYIESRSKIVPAAVISDRQHVMPKMTIQLNAGIMSTQRSHIQS